MTQKINECDKRIAKDGAYFDKNPFNEIIAMHKTSSE